MDMVNDGKDIRLDTPQAVKEALASGKDLYNPQTGKFWWEYNYTGSIANTYVHLDDPNLLAVVDNPDFDLYEDIVGGLNYTGYITDSIETIIEDGEENAPLIDPRDEVFAQIASEDGWVIASPENVRKAVQSHMAENGADAPGKKNGMDKTAEIAAWKEKHVPIDRNGDDALVMHKMADGSREFIVAHGYDEETGHWGHGTYYDSLASAAADLEGRSISTPGMEVICPDFWYRDDIESALEEAGLEVNDANVDAALEALDLDGEPILSNFHERLAETGNEMIADAVDNIEPNGGDGDSPEAFVDRGCHERVSRKGNRVLSYIDYLGHEQVCPIDRTGETHLYGFDATEPGSFDEVIECRQLLDIREMLGNDHITLGGEAQAMKAASAEMAESMEKHDIVLDAR